MKYIYSRLVMLTIVWGVLILAIVNVDTNEEIVHQAEQITKMNNAINRNQKSEDTKKYLNNPANYDTISESEMNSMIEANTKSMEEFQHRLNDRIKNTR